MVLLVPNRLRHFLFLPACLLRPWTTSQACSPILQDPKTVSLIYSECIGCERTLSQGLTVNVVAPVDATLGSNLPVVIVSSIFISSDADHDSPPVDLRRRLRDRRYQQVSDSSLLSERRNINANSLLVMMDPSSSIRQSTWMCLRYM